MTDDRLIRNVSDTARWVAAYRAMETERPDALFRDPFAQRLMGERGPAIVKEMSKSMNFTWPFTARTLAFDDIILTEVAAGCDMVVNLAAGLDARPYRMALPPSLTWVEVDLPGILNEKEAILANDIPVCQLERVKLDLADIAARRTLFAALGHRAKRALVVSEGLTVYLEPDDVGALARDLSSVKTFHRWVTDLGSPRLMRMLNEGGMGNTLREGGSQFKFAPVEGPAYFNAHGWRVIDVRSMIDVAGRLGRLNFPLNVLWRLPFPKGFHPNRPWSGVILLERSM